MHRDANFADAISGGGGGGGAAAGCCRQGDGGGLSGPLRWPLQIGSFG